MTLLVTSIAPDDLRDLEARAARAWAGGADAVEIRIDGSRCDDAAVAAFFQAHPNRRWIVTCRSSAEGGRSHDGAKERALRVRAASDATAAMIDFELRDWLHSPGVRDMLGPLLKSSASANPRLILSSHDFHGGSVDLCGRIQQARDAGSRVVAKAAYLPGDVSDTFAALDLMHEHRDSVCTIAMGEDGLWTRVLATKLGAFATYCALDKDSATAPGQLTLDEMIHTYRWRSITPTTRVYGVIGDPVAHSLSPRLFNHWFAAMDIDAVYLPMRVRRKADCVLTFLDASRARPWLHIGGFSVTVPHKSAVLHWLGENTERMARDIGAVNTILFPVGSASHETGGGAETAAPDAHKPKGYNTDCYAAVSSLLSGLGCTRAEVSGMSVDVLGAGGAARAVLYGLQELGCGVTVYGRSPDRTRSLAEQFRATPASWEDRVSRSGRVLINCTPAGMWPSVDDTPMPAEALAGCELVFDLIYRPPQTRLLRDAAAAGAVVLSGLEMFIRQAAMQFELWTGLRPDQNAAKSWVTGELTREETTIRTEQTDHGDRHND